MVNIAIVDDDNNFIKILKEKLLLIDKTYNVFCYTDPLEFMENAKTINYVLLDIELPQINGIAISKQLRHNNDISVFFITMHEELMIKAFGKNVEGFILKSDIDNGLKRLEKFINIQEKKQFLDVNIKSKTIKLFFDNIYFIKYSLRDVYYYLNNEGKITQKNTNLKDVYSMLDDNFIQISRSVIVNIQYVKNIRNGMVEISGYKLKVSRRKINTLKIKLFERQLSNEFGIDF